MGTQGRYGKYGEIKRLDRLGQSGRRAHLDKAQKDKTKAWPLASNKSFYQRGSVRIREATSRDRGFIGQLSGRVFSLYGPYQEMVIQWFDSGTTASLIASVEGKPVGFAMVGYLLNDPGTGLTCELLAIAVEPEMGRRGVGRRLMEETEKRVAKRGEKRLFLHTAVENIGAQKLFLANDYRPADIKKNFYPAGQDALMMYKETAIGGGPDDEGQA
ncbi:MAG: GNAT family N-acetyltransferase [Proteobacteria bacterium]|nr:GNAT family N-acetyltransferase [Pseudomonadota bacterium]